MKIFTVLLPVVSVGDQVQVTHALLHAFSLQLPCRRVLYAELVRLLSTEMRCRVEGTRGKRRKSQAYLDSQNIGRISQKKREHEEDNENENEQNSIGDNNNRNRNSSNSIELSSANRCTLSSLRPLSTCSSSSSSSSCSSSSSLPVSASSASLPISTSASAPSSVNISSSSRLSSQSISILSQRVHTRLSLFLRTPGVPSETIQSSSYSSSSSTPSSSSFPSSRGRRDDSSEPYLRENRQHSSFLSADSNKQHPSQHQQQQKRYHQYDKKLQESVNRNKNKNKNSKHLESSQRQKSRSSIFSSSQTICPNSCIETFRTLKDKEHSLPEDFHLLIALSYSLGIQSNECETVSDMIYLCRAILNENNSASDLDSNNHNYNDKSHDRNHDSYNGDNNDIRNYDKNDLNCNKNSGHERRRRRADIHEARDLGPTGSFLFALLRYAAEGFPLPICAPNSVILRGDINGTDSLDVAQSHSGESSHNDDMNNSYNNNNNSNNNINNNSKNNDENNNNFKNNIEKSKIKKNDNNELIRQSNHQLLISHFACCYNLISGLLRCLTLTLEIIICGENDVDDSNITIDDENEDANNDNYNDDINNDSDEDDKNETREYIKNKINYGNGNKDEALQDKNLLFYHKNERTRSK